MKQVLRNIPFFGSVIVLLVTASVAFFGLQTLKARDTADEITAQTNNVLMKLDDVLLGLFNMESGLRGYLLTGDNQFMDHYHNGNRQYAEAMTQLKSMTAGNPSLQAHWSKVEQLAQQWNNDWAAQGIKIRQKFDAGLVSNDAITNHVVAESDETVMDQIRSELDAGKQAETSLLVQQLQAGRQADYQAYTMMIFGIIISLLLGLISGLILNRSNIAKARQIELQHLLLEEREKERLQLARDLHDGPVQDLVAMLLGLQELLVAGPPSPVAERLKGLKSEVQTVLADLRASALSLRSPILTKFGLEKAIQTDLENFRQRYPAINVSFEHDQKDLTMPELRQAAIYRIFQEALRNVARHAQASDVNILYHVTEDALNLTIRDNGKGFHVPEDWLTLAQQGHLGLVGIRERTEAIGGTLDLSSSPRSGTRLTITVPLQNGQVGKSQGADLGEG